MGQQPTSVARPDIDNSTHFPYLDRSGWMASSHSVIKEILKSKANSGSGDSQYKSLSEIRPAQVVHRMRNFLNNSVDNDTYDECIILATTVLNIWRAHNHIPLLAMV